MRLHIALIAALLAAAPAAGARAPGFRTPIPASAMQAKLSPGYHHPFSIEATNAAATAARDAAAKAGKLVTLPMWSFKFTVAGARYNATLLGGDPAKGGETVIPTVIVPIRLTIPDYSVDGQTPLVLDATTVTPSILASPLFQPSSYLGARPRQFENAMVRAEFPTAPQSWGLTFSPTVAPTLAITAPKGSVTVYKSASGALLAVVTHDPVIDSAIEKALAAYSPATYVVFVTYNALEHDAFGYHSFAAAKPAPAAIIYTYTSWLVGVDDLFSLPSPDADTFAHEISESTHDPLITSLTKLWGDAFNQNKCFQNTIEVGDAIEDAPAAVQNWPQPIEVNGALVTYTLQNEALLSWFERQQVSTSANGAYSFPSLTALTGPAPLQCKP